MTRTDADSAAGRRKVGLALQGGGSHGAFTWGVLDRLLEEPTLDILGAVGTSAGAMNAVVLADGMVRGGPAEARRRLRQFWEAIGKMPGFATLLGPMSGEAEAALRLEHTPAYLWWETISRNLSPYDLNPAGFNPLRGPLTTLIDFDRLRAEKDFKVMVCATNVKKAQRRVFTNKDISVDAVLASACLPQLFPAVIIDGEPYWDGGYTGNPPISRFITDMPKSDLIIVRVDPVHRNEVPRSPGAIQDRTTELSFNAVFWMELATLGVILRWVDEGLLDPVRFGRIFFHMIEACAPLEKIAHSTKLNNYPTFLEYLFELGRKTADAWWARNGAAIGQRSTLDLQQLLPTDAWPPLPKEKGAISLAA